MFGQKKRKLRFNHGGDEMLVVHVLFVDDEPAILRALKRSLNDEDYEVYVAEGGEAALRVLSEQPIDVVVARSKFD